jgi:hypothetical protein
MDKDDLKYNEDSYGGLSNKKSKKVKAKCTLCGYIGYESKCPADGYHMFKYKNPFR